MTTLEARGLALQIGGREVFAGVDLRLEPGDGVAVFGPSGSGKTSLVSVLGCLQPPSRGKLSVDGQPAGAVHRTELVLAPQTYGLLSLLTASENVEAALRARGCPPAEAIAAAHEALASVGLSTQRDQLVEELSGGQQQRVAVARALARQPAVLLADEPTAEQDADNRRLVIDRLLDVVEAGGAVLVTTHDPDVAKRFARVLRLADGSLVSGWAPEKASSIGAE